MKTALYFCVIVSSLSFFAYGYSYFAGPHMKEEFKRFNLERLGLWVVVLEIIGALGLLIGMVYKPFLFISSLGLALLMFLGLMVRTRLKDSIWVSIPAFFYMVLNAFIFALVMNQTQD